MLDWISLDIFLRLSEDRLSLFITKMDRIESPAEEFKGRNKARHVRTHNAQC